MQGESGEREEERVVRGRKREGEREVAAIAYSAYESQLHCKNINTRVNPSTKFLSTKYPVPQWYIYPDQPFCVHSWPQQ